MSGTSPAPGDQSARWPAMRVIGPLLGVVWVVFLAQPWQAAWRAAPGPARTLALVAIGTQAALFCTLSLAGGPARRRGAFRRSGPLLVAGQLVCVVLAAPGAGADALVGLVFVAVSAVIVLPSTTALVVVVACVLAVPVVPRVTPGMRVIDDLTLSIVLASAAVFGFSRLVASNRQLLAARDEVAVLAVDRERERIARDMHDILGHTLTVVAVKAELAGRLVDRDPARARDEIAQVQALARRALADVRAMVSATIDVTLAGELAGARHALDTAGIEAEVPMVIDQVPDDLRPLFAWTVREGVTNVLRHAAARHVRIDLADDHVVVEDDGRGHRDHAAGHGLVGLSERARAVGAVVETATPPGGGYRLTVARRPTR